MKTFSNLAQLDTAKILIQTKDLPFFSTLKKSLIPEKAMCFLRKSSGRFGQRSPLVFTIHHETTSNDSFSHILNMNCVNWLY